MTSDRRGRFDVLVRAATMAPLLPYTKPAAAGLQVEAHGERGGAGPIRKGIIALPPADLPLTWDPTKADLRNGVERVPEEPVG